MLILDTDHATLLGRNDSREGNRLRDRLRVQPREIVVTTVVTYEEHMRGWLAYVAKARDVTEQVKRYLRLNEHIEFYRTITVLPFDADAAVAYQRLRSERIRIGSMDLKIAAIALSNHAILLTRNKADFEEVPDLIAEDWTS